MFGFLSRFIRGRLARSTALKRSITFNQAVGDIVATGLLNRFEDDLVRVANKNPSVIKTDDYEIYHSSNGSVYAYWLSSGERRIYPRGSI